MKPRAKVATGGCVADRYAGPDERIVEVSAGTAGAGCLISIVHNPADDSLIVCVYRGTRTTVIADGKSLKVQP